MFLERSVRKFFGTTACSGLLTLAFAQSAAAKPEYVVMSVPSDSPTTGIAIVSLSCEQGLSPSGLSSTIAAQVWSPLQLKLKAPVQNLHFATLLFQATLEEEGRRFLSNLQSLTRTSQLRFFRQIENILALFGPHGTPSLRSWQDLKDLQELHFPLRQDQISPEAKIAQKYATLPFDAAPILPDGTFDWSTKAMKEAAFLLHQEIEALLGMAEAQNPNGELSPEQAARVLRTSRAWDLTLEKLYSGNNAKTREISADDLFDTEFRGSLDALIQSERFRSTIWWANARSETWADVNGSTSLSPARIIYGPSVKRNFFWRLKRDLVDPEQLDLERIRIALNEVDGKAVSLEVFARSSPDQDWEAFFYQRVGDRWIPSQKFMGMEVNRACLNCHAGSDGKLSPLPNQLHSETDLRKVGYENTLLIRGLLKSK